jgi:type I restriction enzyme, S subunit
MKTEELPPDWKIARLGDVGEISGGGTPSTKDSAYWGGTVPWLVPGEVTKNNSLYIAKTERMITDAGLADSVAKLLPVGTVMMTSRATIGEVVINTVPMATNQGFINVSCNSGIIHNEYLAYWMRRNKHLFEDRAHGSTFKEISKSNFKTISIALPPLPEQRAIAYALRTIQEAIETRQRELELERERKAALMQHLFTHGTRGEKTKQTDIGEMPKTWELVPLGEVCQDVPQNGAFIKNAKFGNGMPYVNVYDIYQSAVVDLGKVERVECEWSQVEQYSLCEDDLLFVRSSLKREGIGQCCLVRGVNERVIFDNHLIRLTPRQELVDPLYLTYFSLSERGRTDIVARSKTTTMTTINQKAISTTWIPLPTLDEQRGIAAILSLCDAKIDSLTHELLTLEELFRAMLDQLMTGLLPASPLIKLEATYE